MRAAVALLSLILLAPLVAADHVDRDDIQWACGGFRSGHPDDCGIDPVGGDAAVNSEGDPQFAADWPSPGLDGDARVLGIVHGGDVRAYPVRMLNTHEIVNDVIGGEAVAVTFCPLCGSGVSFLRTIDGQETNFTASGYLYRTDMVMWDPETNLLWNQITGTPIGELGDDRPERGHSDVQLDFIPTSITTWDNWRSKHPDTVVLQPVFAPGNYRENAYTVTRSDNCQHGYSGERDCDVDGIHPKVQVVAHDDGNGVAFPIHDVAAVGAAQLVTADGMGYVGTADVHGDARIFGDGGHTFTADDSGLWTDETGGLWDLREGIRLDAPGRLEPVDTVVSFWFAWHDHHPDTAVWLPDGGAAAPPPDGRGTPGPAVAILGATLLVAAGRARKGL